jgi:hypothetical protein
MGDSSFRRAGHMGDTSVAEANPRAGSWVVRTGRDRLQRASANDSRRSNNRFAFDVRALAPGPEGRPLAVIHWAEGELILTVECTPVGREHFQPLSRSADILPVTSAERTDRSGRHPLHGGQPQVHPNRLGISV